MAELERLLKSVEGKSENTIKSYKLQYKKLSNLLDKDVGEASQDKIIEVVKEHENNNGKQALLNIAILVRRLDGKSVVELEKMREKLKGAIKTDIQKKNVNLSNSLPSYQDIVDYTESLYDKSDWTNYIINYLLLNYNVRNKDLLFDIVRRKKYTKEDKTKNYMWLSETFVDYIRNDYKTAALYGQIVIRIKDKKFITAIRRVFACQKHNEECGVFIPTESQLGYYLKKATLGGIGEAAYNKIIINHFRTDIDKLKQISKSRGTSISTLLDFYDIKNIMKDDD
jgi:archaellin